MRTGSRNWSACHYASSLILFLAEAENFCSARSSGSALRDPSEAFTTARPLRARACRQQNCEKPLRKKRRCLHRRRRLLRHRRQQSAARQASSTAPCDLSRRSWIPLTCTFPFRSSDEAKPLYVLISCENPHLQSPTGDVRFRRGSLIRAGNLTQEIAC